MNKKIKFSVLQHCIYRLDKADYADWEGKYGTTRNLRDTAKLILGDAYDDVVKCRKGNPHGTGETTYKPIFDRLREMGYEIVGDRCGEDTGFDCPFYDSKRQYCLLLDLKIGTKGLMEKEEEDA